MTDCTGEGKLQGDNQKTGVTINGGTFNLYGGTITGFVNGVQIGQKSSPAAGSTFTMYGGTITGNVGSSGGGGVFLVGTTTQNIDPTFIMHGGTISNNTADASDGGGGGVYVGEKCSFTMDGGTITGNETTSGNGGGIYIDNLAVKAEISNATITDNKATATGNTSRGLGGGIYSQKSLTVSGSTITNNEATYHGGGICGAGSITLVDTKVTNNRSTASNGGGVYASKMSATSFTNQPLSVSGSTKISGNAPNNYYANEERQLPIKVTGTLTDDAVIYIDVLESMKPDVGGKRIIAEPATGVALDAKNFKAGATDCVTGLDTDGTVYLALCAHEMDSTGYTCSKCGVTLDARVGESAYYQTLAKAFDATKGDTVTLLRDVTLNANCSVAFIYDTTLDLNGKSISGANYHVPVGGGNIAGTLTIKNSDANSGAQALNAKFLVYSNGKLAVDSSYTGDIECVKLQAGGTLERLSGKIGELILGTAASSATSTDYNVTLWNGNTSYCTIGKITDSTSAQSLTVADLLQKNHAKCELYGEKDGTWSAIDKTIKISELNGYTAYRVQFPECVHQCEDDTVSAPKCSRCGKALVVKATAKAADGTTKTAYFTADSTLENGYVEAVQTLNNWSSEGCKDATLMPFCNVHNGTGGIGIASVTLTGTLAVDGGEHRIYRTIVANGADVTFKSGEYNYITVNGKAAFVGGTYLDSVTADAGAEAVFSGGEYQSLRVKEGGTAVVKDSAAFKDDVEIRGTLNVEDGSFAKQVLVQTGCTLNVSGGVFTGTGYKNVTYESGSYGTISGGTFTELLIRGDTVRLSGGTFTKLSSDVLSSLLADNAAYYDQNGDAISDSEVSELNNVTVQTHEHNVDESTGICSECLKQMTASLTIDGVTSWYTTFEAVAEAANAANGEKTIKLYQNVNGNNSAKYELTNGPVTLETGEKTIQKADLIAKGIALEIKGTGGAGAFGTGFYVIADGAGAKVTVSDSETVIYDITAQNGGKLLLSAGKYLYLKVADGDSSAELSGGTYNEITYDKSAGYVSPGNLLKKGYGYWKNEENSWATANDMLFTLKKVTVEKAPVMVDKIYPADKTDYTDSSFNTEDTTVTLTATISPSDATVTYVWYKYFENKSQWYPLTYEINTSGLPESYTGADSATLSISDLTDNQTYQYRVRVTASDGYACDSESFTVTTNRCKHDWDANGKCTLCDYQCPHKNATRDEQGVWTCDVCKTQMIASVTKDGATTYGTDLATALNEAADGTTVSLLTDTSLSQTVFICGADDNSNKTVTLDLSGHEFTSSYIFKIGTTPPYGPYGADFDYYPGTLKIIGKGNVFASLTVASKGALDLSGWEGDTIQRVSLSQKVVGGIIQTQPKLIVGEKAGRIEELGFGNWQSSETKNIKLSGGSYGEILLNVFDYNLCLQLHDALADGYAFQNSDGTYVSCTETLAYQGIIHDLSVVKCPHRGTSGVSEDGKCACGKVQFVAQITSAAGSTVYYATLTDAAKALADGDTLKLLVDADSVTIDKAVIVDLNGHKLNALTANAKLTVKDSGETKGTIGTLTAGNGLTLGNLLADGYGFKTTDGTWVAETATSASNVTVQEAPLKNVKLTANSETMKYGQSQTVTLEVSYETVGEGSASQTWYAVAEDGTATPIADETGLTYTLPADLSAGTYTYRVTVSKDGYSRSVDIDITIEKLDLKDATVVLENGGVMMFFPDKYGAGTEVTQNVESVTVNDIVMNKADYEVTGNVEADAGSYKLTVTAADDSVNFTGSIQVDWTIRAHKLSSAEITSAIKDYDGTADFPVPGNVVTGMFVSAEEKSDYSAGAVKLSEGKDYKLSDMTYDSPDAGEDKTISYTIELLSGNYIFDNGTMTKTFTENSTTSVGLEFKINKVDAEATEAPAAKNLTYNGEEQQLVTAGTANGGTMQYSLNGVDYSDVIPTGKDAATYTVYYKVVGDKNHNNTVAQSVEVTIGKAAVTVTADDKSSRVGKDLEELTYTYSPELFGNDVFTGTLATEADKDIVKTYTITQGTLALSGNYTITFVSGTYTVEAKIIPTVVEGTLSATEITYGQPLSESKITGTIKGDVPGVFAWMDGTMMLDAGIHEVSWIFTPENIADYTLVTDKVKVIVNPKSIEGATVTLNQNSFEYNTTEQAPIVTGVKLGDTMLNTADYSVTIKAQINAGDYTVTITGKGNYTGTATASWTITPKTVTNPTIELTGSFSYTGEAIEPAVIVKDGEIEIPVGEYEVSYKDNTNAGAATVTITDKEGGNYTVNGSTTFKIEKVDSEVTAAPEANELIYNGSEQELVTAGEAKGGTMQYSLNGADYSETIPTGKDAKIYTVYYKVVGDGNHNDTIAQSVEVTIGKAAVTVTADDKSSRVGKELETLTYTCAPGLFGDDVFTGTLATTADKDAVNTYEIMQGSLALSNNYIITFVPGTYTVEAKLEQSGFKFSENAQTRTCGDADFTVSTDGVAENSTVTYSSSNTDVATVDNNGKVHILKVGSTVIIAKASETADYLEATASYTLTVAKKSITAPVADATVFTYNGKAQTYKLTAGEGYAISGSLTETNANDNGYLITVSLTDKQNTKWAGSEDDVTDKSFRFVIRKAAVSVTAKDRSAYVGDTAPALPAEAVKGTDYTVSGLFDEDALSGTVTLTYAGTPDMTKEGIASINISGTLANDNYTVSYVPGKLTIVNRPSSGGSDSGNSGNSGSGTSGGNDSGNSGNSGSGTTGGNGSGNSGNSGSGTTGNNGLGNSGNSGSGTTGGNGSGNTGSGTTDSNGAGNTGSETTGNNGSGNTGSDTTEMGAKPGTETNSDTSKETTPAQINVIISRGENTVQIAAKVNENVVTVDTIDFDKLDDVINGTDDVVTIDISKIESDKTIDTVELSAEVVNKLAETNVDVRLAVVRGGTAIELDVKALSKKLVQADDSNLILSIKEVTDNMLTLAQMQTIGQRPAFDINLFSGDVRISAMGKEITIRVPYQLAEGETAEGIKVYYVDDEGNKEPCETFYDEAAGCVSWKTTHLSIYMIDYEAAVDEVLADEAPAANDSNIILWIVLGVVVLAVVVAVAAVINSRKKQKA